MDKKLSFIDSMIIEFQLDIEPQSLFNMFESFLQCAKWIIQINVPFQNLPFFGFPHQGLSYFLSFLLRSIKKKLRQTQIRHSTLINNTLNQKTQTPDPSSSQDSEK